MALLRSRFAGLYLFGALFLGASLVLRAALAIHSHAVIDTTTPVLFKMFCVGFLYDLVTYFYCVIPAAIFLLVVPDKVYHRRVTRMVVNGVYFAVVLALVFDVIAEWLFWSEFGTRYNFVSVDYLAYTHQFTGTLVESLPIPILAGLLIAGTATIYFATRPVLARTFESATSFGQRLGPGVVFVLVPIVAILLVDPSLAEITRNHYNNELSKNGVYSFAAAVRYNIASYDTDYPARDARASWDRLRRRMESDGAVFAPLAGPADPLHKTVATGPEAPCNVIIVVVESLGAEYLGAFGNRAGLAPNLDALAPQGLLFTRFYATGTRTDRGLEAVASSMPPTPGRCTLKKTLETNDRALGLLMRERGYETRFLTGCDGTFDNMRGFFEQNGFDVIDRSAFGPGEVTFENVWGVCDEDLLAKTVRECDGSAARGRRFFSIVMTESNHQPFTVPAKAAGWESKTREAAVRYTDYAIGTFVASARTKPWFKDTIFVFLGDHCANCAGRADVAIEDYHIPAIIFAPGRVAPGRVETIAGQVDIAPTVLGLMNLGYESRFFGRDVLKGGEGRALVSNYQDFGYLTRDRLVVLGPERRTQVYQVGPAGDLREFRQDEAAEADAIAIYQNASTYVQDRLLEPEPPMQRFAEWASSLRKSGDK